MPSTPLQTQELRDEIRAAKLHLVALEQVGASRLLLKYCTRTGKKRSHRLAYLNIARNPYLSKPCQSRRSCSYMPNGISSPADGPCAPAQEHEALSEVESPEREEARFLSAMALLNRS